MDLFSFRKKRITFYERDDRYDFIYYLINYYAYIISICYTYYSSRWYSIPYCICGRNCLRMDYINDHETNNEKKTLKEGYRVC